MIINDVHFNADLEDILHELQAQLIINHISLLQKLKNSGGDIMVQCPYHGNGQERKPSAGIRKSDGLLHCFACGETHSLQEVISHCFGRNDDLLGTFGWNWLLKNFASVQMEERKDVEIDLERNNISIKANVGNSKLDISNTAKPQFVSEAELDKYRYYHPYWKKRGITDERIIELFDLGYDSEQDTITFPIRDTSGNCLFVARRSVQTKFFSYPPDVEKPIYGLYELSISTHKFKDRVDEIILCESMIDCILLWQAGYYALAMNGLGSELQYHQLRYLPCRKLILATDNDEKGQEARKTLHRKIQNKLITEIQFPTGIKDIGECTQEQIKNILRWEEF